MEIDTKQPHISCPKCNCTVDCDPVSVIRDDGPELGLLYEGRLNRPRCSGCNTEFLVEVPIVYRDDANPYLVYYLPLPVGADVTDAVKTVGELYSTVFKDIDEIDRPPGRLATTRRDFIEKIALHRSNYDDRLIEYVKYQLFQHSKGLDPHSMELLFDFGASTPDNIMFLAFKQNSGEPAYSLGFPMPDFAQLKEYFLESTEMETRLSNMFRPFYVNVADLL